jgi:SAM-dependent methyltransferase
MMRYLRRLLLMEKHTCPWWLAYSWDHRLRTFIHDPGRIILPHVSVGDRVLDLGCGMGFFSLAMAGFVGGTGKVYALDIQQKMLDVLMKRAGARNLDRRIVPIFSNGRDLAVPEPVDFILSFWMLHEVDGKADLVRGLYEILRESGYFLLVEPKIHTPADTFQEETALCRDAGFMLIDYPDVRMSRAALFGK